MDENPYKAPLESGAAYEPRLRRKQRLSASDLVALIAMLIGGWIGAATGGLLCSGLRQAQINTQQGWLAYLIPMSALIGFAAGGLIAKGCVILLANTGKAHLPNSRAPR
jgi:hypothetical protein